ncbi:MAG TPA: SRPBCC family protein [Gammaproteobacteria bacterium]|nr:SRPBCC family protein [Gammaproteobacteria bacterium]
MYKVSVERTLDMPRKQVFGILTQFGGLEKILPDMIDALELVGSGLGALRKIKVTAGGTVIERLDAAYDERLFAYTITYNDALPFENYCAVVTLEDAGGKTRACWSSNWDAKGASEEEIKTMLTGLYGTLLEGLYKLA